MTIVKIYTLPNQIPGYAPGSELFQVQSYLSSRSCDKLIITSRLIHTPSPGGDCALYPKSCSWPTAFHRVHCSNQYFYLLLSIDLYADDTQLFFSHSTHPTLIQTLLIFKMLFNDVFVDDCK